MSAEAAHEEFHWSADIRFTVGQLRSRARTIALVCLCFGAAALAYLTLVPPRYTASTEIFLDPRGLQVVANDVSPRAESNEFSVSLVESQLRVAQSEGVLRGVVRRLDVVIAVLGGLVLTAVAIVFFGHRPMGRPHL